METAKIFVRLFSAGTAIAESELTSANFQDEWVSGGTFNALTKKNLYHPAKIFNWL